MKEKFDKLNTKYHKMHKLISHSRKLTQKELDNVQSTIDGYITTFTSLFPDQNITPKQHILQNHCTPFIQATGFGLGLLGEQVINNIF